MDHVAILRKANISKGDNLLQDIINGTKTIESRWYVNKVSPWNLIIVDDVVYFKESGCPVTAKALVSKVLQFELLSPQITNEIIDKYGKKISPNTTIEQWQSWASSHQNKKYCVLVFLDKVEKVTPFNINKTGFGISSAWLAVGDINKYKKVVK